MKEVQQTYGRDRHSYYLCLTIIPNLIYGYSSVSIIWLIGSKKILIVKLQNLWEINMVEIDSASSDF